MDGKRPRGFAMREGDCIGTRGRVADLRSRVWGGGHVLWDRTDWDNPRKRNNKSELLFGRVPAGKI